MSRHKFVYMVVVDAKIRNAFFSCSASYLTKFFTDLFNFSSIPDKLRPNKNDTSPSCLDPRSVDQDIPKVNSHHPIFYGAPKEPKVHFFVFISPISRLRGHHVCWAPCSAQCGHPASGGTKNFRTILSEAGKRTATTLSTVHRSRQEDDRSFPFGHDYAVTLENKTIPWRIRWDILLNTKKTTFLIYASTTMNRRVSGVEWHAEHVAVVLVKLDSKFGGYSTCVTVPLRIVNYLSIIHWFYWIAGFHCTRFHWGSSL